MIDLKNGYFLHKIDPYFPGDIWLMEEWNKDELLTSRVWPLNHNLLPNLRYLNYEELYGSPCSIWYQNQPIGFIDISDIFLNEYVIWACGILESYRNCHHTSYVLKVVAKELFSDPVHQISYISMIIAKENEAIRHTIESIGCVKVKEKIAEDSDTYHLYPPR